MVVYAKVRKEMRGCKYAYSQIDAQKWGNVWQKK
jgi:hypothetical protein